MVFLKTIACAILLVFVSFQETTQTSKITIKDAACLIGHWKGEMFGGKVEEIWSPPMAGTMMGMYKMVKDDKVVFYELMIIKEEKNSLVLKLKHFDPDLIGWEEKGVTVDFPLKEKTDEALVFDGLSFRKEGQNTLNCSLRMKQKKGPPKYVKWAYKRVKQ